MPAFPEQLQPILPLPSEEVEKICAGEVIERPLSVVKELIENALDAGATEITIELEDGGKQLVRVTDNGAGIPFEELPLALKAHCTSKIRCLDDLYALATLGFRGEALSSIAAIARLTLSSRRQESELGGRVSAAAGELAEHARISMHSGTEVEVRDLFFNTPVRKKFLKSKQSEQSQITTLLDAYALAYPAVRWRLTASDRQLLLTDGQGGLQSVLADLLGAECGGELAPIDFEFPPSAVSGYVSDPRHHRHNRTRQWYFVNQRPVSNKLLYKAVDDAVREFLSPGKFPLGAFFIDLPPEEVDVNVHPMKTEVNFAQPQAVYSLLFTAVQRALGAAATSRQHQLTRGLSAVIRPALDAPEVQLPLPTAFDPSCDPDAPAGQRAIPLFEQGQRIILPQAAAPLRAEQSGAPVEIQFPGRYRGLKDPEAAPAGGAPGGLAERLNEAVSALEVSRYPAAPAAEIGADAPAGELGGSAGRPPALEEFLEAGHGTIAQVADSFLVISTPEAVYLVDQHAAHERVLFEQLYEQARRQDGAPAPRQRLLFPLIVPLSAGEFELAQQYIAAFAQLGFAGELGAGRSLIISEVPLSLARQVGPELIQGALAELAHFEHSALLEDLTKALAASLACRAAVKANYALPPAERAALIEQIVTRLSSLTCPHGRPTVLRLGSDELRRIFLR